MVDFRKLVLTRRHRGSEDGREPRPPIDCPNSLVVLKRHSAQICELARLPHQPRFPKNISFAMDIYIYIYITN